MAKLLSEQQQRYWQGWLADCKDEESSALSYVEVQDIRALLDHIEAQEEQLDAAQAEAAVWLDTARWLWRHANGFHIADDDTFVQEYNDKLSYTAEIMTDQRRVSNGQALP